MGNNKSKYNRLTGEAEKYDQLYTVAIVGPTPDLSDMKYLGKTFGGIYSPSKSQFVPNLIVFVTPEYLERMDNVIVESYENGIFYINTPVGTVTTGNAVFLINSGDQNPNFFIRTAHLINDQIRYPDVTPRDQRDYDRVGWINAYNDLHPLHLTIPFFMEKNLIKPNKYINKLLYNTNKMADQFGNINLFKELYGPYINEEIIQFFSRFPRVTLEDHKQNLSKQSNTMILTGDSYVFFVRDVNGNWVNKKIDVANAFAGNSGQLRLVNTMGVLNREYNTASASDMIIFDESGTQWGVLKKAEKGKIYYVYLNLRYTNSKQFIGMMNTYVGLKRNITYNRSNVTNFIDFVIRTNPNVAPVNEDSSNIDQKTKIDNAQLNPPPPSAINAGPINNQNIQEYTPSPFFQPTQTPVTYLTNNNQNVASTVINTPLQQEEENIGESNEDQNTDINTRDAPVTNEDVFEFQKDTLYQLSSFIPFQPIDPNLVIQTEAIPNPFNNNNANNANDLGEDLEQNESAVYPAPQYQYEDDEDIPEEERYLFTGVNNIGARIAGSEQIISNMFDMIFNEAAGFKYLPPNPNAPLPYVPMGGGAIPNALPPPPLAGGAAGGIPPPPPGVGVGAALAGMPNAGIYLPGALRNKWVLLAITSSVIVGSFTFLTYLYSDSIKDKIASITSVFINQLEPTLPDSPVQLVQIDEYGNPIRTLNTQQEVVDSYIEAIKLSPTLDASEHLLVDPLLESVVVDTVTMKEDNKATTSVFVNMKETMYNIVKSGSGLFEGFIPSFISSSPNTENIKVSETLSNVDGDIVLGTETVIETKTTIISKLGEYASYAWNLIWFLVRKVIEVLEKVTYGAFSLSKTGFLILAGAIIVGAKYYLDRK